MKQVQISDRQSSFIFYLVHQGKGRTEAARLAGFAAPRQSAFTLTQSPKIIAKIRQEDSLKFLGNSKLPNPSYCNGLILNCGIVWNRME